MGRHFDEGPRGSGVQVIFVSEVARSATVRGALVNIKTYCPFFVAR